MTGRPNRAHLLHLTKREQRGIATSRGRVDRQRSLVKEARNRIAGAQLGHIRPRSPTRRFGFGCARIAVGKSMSERPVS